MRTIQTLLRHPLVGPAIRYGIAGATVAAVYIGVPLLLNGVFGVWIQLAIPVAYVLAITLHFNLQRHFVFRHVDEFALSVRQQIGRYAAIGAIQYPTTALATAFLPGLFGVSERIMFVIITLVISVTFFLVLRGHVFHPDVDEERVAESIAERRLAAVEASEGAHRDPDPISS